MNHKARIKSLVEPVLERNPDLVAIGGTSLWLRPIHHIGRCFTIKPEQDHGLRLSWGLENLFVPFSAVDQSTKWFERTVNRTTLYRWVDYHPRGDILTRSGPDEFLNWKMDQWNYADASMAEDFLFQIEARLRLLRSLDTSQKCIGLMRARNVPVFSLIKNWIMFENISLGHLNPAYDHWVTIRQNYVSAPATQARSSVEVSHNRYLELDEPLLARDGKALAALLHRWEAENVKTKGLEHVWTPSPFPIEDLM